MKQLKQPDLLYPWIVGIIVSRYLKKTPTWLILLLSVLGVIFINTGQSAAQTPPAVTQLGTAMSQYGTNTTLSSFTVPAGTNRLLVVVASDTQSTNVTGVTFNGTPMTEVLEDTDGVAVDSIYVLALGTSGASTTGDIVATTGGGVTDEKFIAAVVFENVDQADPTSSEMSQQQTSNSSLNVTSADGDLVFDVIDTFRPTVGPATLTVGAGQTQLHDQSGSVTSGGFAHYSTSMEDGAAIVTMSWTTNATVLLHMAMNINAARSGTIQIIKDTVPDAAQDFSFTTTGGLVPATFDLDDDADGTLSNTQTFNNVTFGTYTVTEAAVAGYTTTLNCVDPDGGSMTSGSTATIDLDPGETVTCTFSNVAQPDLIATKTNDTGGIGAVSIPFAWTITITNTSTAAATFASTEVILRDNLPTGATYDTPSATNLSNVSGTISCTIISSTLTCTASGAVTINSGGSFDVVFAVTPTTTGNLVNPTGGICEVDPDNTITESDESNNSCSDTLTVNPPPGFAKVFSSDTIATGGTSTLTFTIDNSASTVAATSLDFTDNLPAGLTVASPANAATTCTGGTLTATPGSGMIIYTGGTVAAGASCTISVDVTASVLGNLVNTSGDLTSSLGSSGIANDTLTIQAVDLQISKDDGGVTVEPGELIIYTLTFTNAGDLTGNNTTITETVPANTTFNSGASTGGWSCAGGDPAGSVCTLNVGAIAGGTGGTADFAVNVDNGVSPPVSQIDNTAEIGDNGSNGPDATPADNSSSDSTPLNIPGTIIIQKVTEPGGASEIFTFTDNILLPNNFTLTDGATEEFNDITSGTYTVTEASPAGGYSLSSIACDDGASATPSTGNIGSRTATINLDPGETVTCTFTNSGPALVDDSLFYLPLILKSFGFTSPTPKPDLIVTALSLTPNGDGTHTVQVTGFNQSTVGVTPGNNFFISIYVDPPEPFTDTSLPPLSVLPALNLGLQSAWFGPQQGRTVQGIISIVNGPHRVYAWIDPFPLPPPSTSNGTVDEQLENNNTRLLEVTISGVGLDDESDRVSESPPGIPPTPTPGP